MSKREIKSIKVINKKGGTITTRFKPTKKAVITFTSIFSVIILALGIYLTVQFINRFSPTITDKHQIMNALPNSISATVVLKDGGLYLCSKDSQTLIDANVYDSKNNASASQVAYFWDDTKSRLYYLADVSGQKNLMQYSIGDKKPTLICKNVSSWTISPDKQKLAIVTHADTTGMRGNLLLVEDGVSTLLEAGCAKTQATYFSGDSSTLYALVGNKPMSELRMYRNGTVTTALDEMFAFVWTSNNGNSYMTVEMGKTITNEQSAIRLYNYTVHTVDGKRVQFKDAYYLEISPDGSVIYIMHSYDEKTQLFTLTAIDTVTLNTSKIAENVFTVNTQAVTDCAQGVVYALESSVADMYDIYYFDTIRNKSNIILKNTYAESTNKIAINPAKQNGYVLSVINNTQKLYEIIFENGNIKTEIVSIKNGKKDVQQMHEILYYEACDQLVISANASATSVELYCFDGKKSKKLINDCGAIYDGGEYFSCSMLTNDGKYLIYLKDVVAIDETDDDKFADHPTAQIYGKLRLFNTETAEFTIINDDVLADSFDCIQADASGSNLYYSKLTLSGKYDIYHYDTATNTNTLLMQEADAMFSITNFN